MIPAFMIGLREGLEAALIVGIVAAYLVKIGRRDTLPQVTLGVVAALGLSLVAGIVVVLTIGRLPIAVQEGIEALAALFAVAVLTWMLFWMRRQGRALKGQLEQGVQSALGKGSAMALIGLVFFAVIRESLEMVLLLLAILSSEGATLPVFVGIVGGILGAVALGAAIFRYGVRVDLRRFFNVTGFILIFVAAGLCAFAVHALGEAGVINNTGTVFDLSSWLPTTSPLGAVLAGLFGYRSTPTPLEVLAYLAYLIPVMTAFLWGGRTRPKAVAPAATAISAIVLAIVIAGCTSGASPTPAASASPAGSAGASAGPSASTRRHRRHRLGQGVRVRPIDPGRAGWADHVRGDERRHPGARVRDLQGRHRGRRDRGPPADPDPRPDRHPRARRIHVRLQAQRPRLPRDERDADRHRQLIGGLVPSSGILSPLGACPVGSIDVPVTPEMIHVWTAPGVPEQFGDLADSWRRAYVASAG